MKNLSPKSSYQKVNGISLHYLDWGGQGTVLLFLTGLGNSAYIYGKIAPRFADRFHVIVLTRRGHGDSDYPESGYDSDTLTEDVYQFIRHLRVKQVIIAGHSMANIEMCHLSAQHPELIQKMVFFDANYDRSSESFKTMIQLNPLRLISIPGQDDVFFNIPDYIASVKKCYPEFAAIWGTLLEDDLKHVIEKNAEGKIIDKMSANISQQLYTTLRSYSPEDSAIQVPVLSFFALKPAKYYLSSDYMTEEQQSRVTDYFENILPPLQQLEIEKFKKDVPQARIVEVPEGHHYCFIKQEELVYSQMCNFLAE